MRKELRQLLPDGRFGDVPAARAATMKAVRSFGNRTTETRLRMALVRAGAGGWQVQPGGAAGNPDFVFPAEKVVLFTDGCFWHGCEECRHGAIRSNAGYWSQKIAHRREKDARVSAELRQSGWRVLRFWEHEIRDALPEVVARIQREIPARPARRSRDFAPRL